MGNLREIERFQRKKSSFLRGGFEINYMYSEKLYQDQKKSTGIDKLGVINKIDLTS